MGLSCEEIIASMSKIHGSPLMMRNASSLSTESSEFEFEFHDESPHSPKLLLSPNYSIYTPNHLPDGENASKASLNQFSAERDNTPNHFPDGESNFLRASSDYQQYIQERFNVYSAVAVANSAQNGLMSSLSGADSGSGEYKAEIKGAVHDKQQELWDKFGHISAVDHTSNDSCDASARVIRANDDSYGGRKGTYLRSLLNRRDLEQLPPLTNYNNFQGKKGKCLASAKSPSSSPLNHHANRHSPNPCKCENYCSHSPEASTSPQPDSTKRSEKKCRKWAFNLNFLRNSPSPRVDQALNHRRYSSDNYSDDSPNHDIAAAAEDARVENYFQERDYCNRAEGRQRPDHHYRAAGAASEARFNQLVSQNIGANYPAAGDYAQRENRLIQQHASESIDHYRASATAEITEYESPWQSTCSSSVCSSPRHEDNEMIRANRKKVSRSAPMSPAGSPPRLSDAGAGDQCAFTRGRRPLSPHALHYQQKKARDDELRRRTFLPYRQSLLGACFFPISTNPHNPKQAVH